MSVFLFLLTGCAHTSLSPTTGIIKTPLSLPTKAVCVSGIPKTLGHQYGFILLPIGVVDSSNLEARIVEEMMLRSAPRGLALQSSCERPGGFLLKIENLSITAYDFFFVRRISALLQATLLTPDGRHMALHGESNSWRRYGFNAQLETAFHEAAQAAFLPIRF